MTTDKLKILKNLSILVVDDDEQLRKELCDTLQLFFEQTFRAANGAEALSIMEKNSVDMIITDYVMPVMNGYDLAHTLRGKNRTLPIVILSSYSDREKLLSAIPLNLTAYLLKPVEYAELIKTLRAMVQKLIESGFVYHRITENVYYYYLTKSLRIDDESVKLSKNEISLIELLVQNKNKLVSTDAISYSISNDGASEQAIKSLIFRMRAKIGKNTIVNIQNLGYMLVSNY